MFKQDLSSASWKVSPLGDLAEVPDAAKKMIEARVPGCVHLDLIGAGIIMHPREGFAELDQFWVGKTDWRYECEFEASEAVFEHERIDLVCDGLDTIASVELNGARIGEAANMFHPHRFDVRGAVKRGGNRLAITFKSPLRHIREEEARVGARPVNGDWDPYIFIRKQASNFGWDFAPKVPTSGIWKPIRLEAWSGVRIAGVRPRVYRLRDDAWRVSIETDLEWSRVERPASGLALGVALAKHGIDAWGSTSPEPGKPATITFDVDSPRVWWPNGHGEQPLYRLTLSLRAGGGSSTIVDDWSADIGFREVRLHTEPDEHGSRFEFHVNGRPIFCKGANWVPEGLFAPEVTPETYRQRVKQAADANMNMLRVWGGGYYESEEFYRSCDELGILVWQDFMFACAMYPEEAPYPALVEAEARHQITRLSSHPCLALWCGGNECIWAYEAWGNAPGEKPWKERLGGKSWGRGYYLDLLPRLVSELDPTLPYWANSPWSGSEAIPTNGDQHGDRHTWDVRVEGYRKIVPRFCSEFGQQAPAAMKTLKKAAAPEGMRAGLRILDHLQRATGGTARHVDAAIAEFFDTSWLGFLRSHPSVLRSVGETEVFEAWWSAAQFVQAEALRIGIEWMRIHGRRCSGALVWQLNDAWPALSWSIIDSEGVPKLALEAVRSAFRPRMLAIHPVNGHPTLFAANDEARPWQGSIMLKRIDKSGAAIADTTVPMSVPPYSVRRVAVVEDAVGAPLESAREAVGAECDDVRAFWFHGGMRNFTGGE